MDKAVTGEDLELLAAGIAVIAGGAVCVASVGGVVGAIEVNGERSGGGA